MENWRTSCAMLLITLYFHIANVQSRLSDSVLSNHTEGNIFVVTLINIALFSHCKRKSPLPAHPSCALLDWDPVTEGAIWVQWTQAPAEESNVVVGIISNDLSFVTSFFMTSFFILLDVDIRRCYTVVVKGWTWPVTAGKLLEPCPVDTEGPKVKETKSPPLHYPASSSLNHWCRTRCLHAFMLFTSNSDTTMRMLQQNSRLTTPDINFSNLLLLYLQFPVLWWQEWNQVWRSSSVVHPVQASTCCVFKDGLLFQLVLPSHNLEPVCPSTSGTNMGFLLPVLPLAGYFLFSDHVL